MTVTDTSSRLGVYGWSPGGGGVHQHRIAEPLRVLRTLGVSAQSGVQLDDVILSQVDTVLVHTLHDERNSYGWELLAKSDSHRMVIDVDDWWWRPDWKPFRRAYTPDALARLYRNVELAHVVTTTTAVLADYLSRYNSNVHVVPNTVPAWLLQHPSPHRPRPVVGYQGSAHHMTDWNVDYQNQVGKFLSRHPDWIARFYGNFTIDAPDGRVEVVPWQSNHDQYWRSVSMDIGLGPLRNTPFNRAKSSLRAVEYAALGIVAVLPDLPPYRGWVDDGVTGRLVRPGQPLSRILAGLAAEPHQLATMAANARQRAAQWTTEACIGKWVEAWNSR